MRRRFVHSAGAIYTTPMANQQAKTSFSMPPAAMPQGVRMPPQNVEAEMSVLGSLMLDKEAFNKISDIIKPECFYRDQHRFIYEAMQNLFEKRTPIDVLSVSNRLREKKQLDGAGGTSYLTTLVNTVPTASNAVHYAEIVQHKYMLRSIISISQEISQLGYQESDEVEKLLDEAEKKIFSISHGSLRQRFAPVAEALGAAWERIDNMQQGDRLRGVPTGFSQLDNLLAGLQKSDMVVLAARPSFGKTSLALDIARHAAVNEKIPVGIFSLEMSTEQLIDRLLAAEANVDSWRLRTGRLAHDSDDFIRIRDALERLSTAPIFIDDEPSNNILQMRAMARRLQAEHGLGLIVVDYLQLITYHKAGSDSLVREVTEISRALKGLARELEVPVLAISQLSRAVEQRHPPIPKLSDLRESGCLTGDTLITHAHTGERIPIKQLVGKTDIPIFSLTNEHKLVQRKISKVFFSGVKMTYKILTRSGRAIKASANHPFLTIGGWQALETLKPHMHIAIPRSIAPNVPDDAKKDSELILLAHLIGDGCILPNQPYHYTSADEKNIAIVSKTAQNLFGIVPRVVHQKNWYHAYLPSPYHLTHNKKHPISLWYGNMNLPRRRSYEKIIPETVFTSSIRHISLFLHHLWATDGNISYKNIPGRKTAGAIYYASSSAQLAEQVQHLLLRLGIFSTLRPVHQKKYRTMYHVYVEGATMQIRFCERVGSYGKRGNIVQALLEKLRFIKANTNTDIVPREAWKMLIEPVKNELGMSWRDVSKKINTAYCGSTLFQSGLSRERMERIATAFQNKPLLRIARSDIFWDEIKSITPLQKEHVFDATVPETHNFVANDIVVHNSIEQDSDVVMFLYREDRYKDDSEQKNVTEVQIAKHRNGPLGKVSLYFNPNTISFTSMEKNRNTDGL
jgi:replicative DNA helicase